MILLFSQGRGLALFSRLALENHACPIALAIHNPKTGCIPDNLTHKYFKRL